MMRFDLRPQNYMTSKKAGAKTGSSDWLKKLFSILVVVLAVMTAISLGYSYVCLRDQRGLLEKQRREVQILERQANTLKKELHRVQNEEKVYQDILELLKRELPSLEILAALEGSLPPRVWIESISVVGTEVSMKGKAFSEADVVEFGNSLAEASIVASVVVPQVSRAHQGSGKTVSFTLDCTLNHISKVILGKGAL